MVAEIEMHWRDYCCTVHIVNIYNPDDISKNRVCFAYTHTLSYPCVYFMYVCMFLMCVRVCSRFFAQIKERRWRKKTRTVFTSTKFHYTFVCWMLYGYDAARLQTCRKKMAAKNCDHCKMCACVYIWYLQHCRESKKRGNGMESYENKAVMREKTKNQ